MEWTDVLKRIVEGESGRPEFKSELGNLRAIGIAICAFANTEGGVIIVGVDDSRKIVGVQGDTERVQERLTSFLQTGCSSPVTARAGRRQDPNGWVHWIEVPRQRGFEPLRYERSSVGSPRTQQRRAIPDRASGALQRVWLHPHGRTPHTGCDYRLV